MFRLVDSTALAMNWVFTVMPESIDAVALSPNISITANRKVELVSIQKELSPFFTSYLKYEESTAAEIEQVAISAIVACSVRSDR